MRRDSGQTVAQHSCRTVQNETPVRVAAWPDRKTEGILNQTGSEGLEKADQRRTVEAGFPRAPAGRDAERSLEG